MSVLPFSAFKHLLKLVTCYVAMAASSKIVLSRFPSSQFSIVRSVYLRSVIITTYLQGNGVFVTRAPLSGEPLAVRISSTAVTVVRATPGGRGELSYLAPLGSENISTPYFKQCFFRGGVLPPRQSNTTPLSPKTEITNILFYILNFASIITFKM